MSEHKDSHEKEKADDDVKGTKTPNVTLRLDLKRLLDWGTEFHFY